MKTKTLMGIILDHRVQEAIRVQTVLTRHGCSIHGRFGMHETSEDGCSDEGLIVLILDNKPAEIEDLKNELAELEGVIVNTMTLG